MGKMVQTLTNRERTECYAIIERMTRGSSHPYCREFVPQAVKTVVESKAKKAVQLPRQEAQVSTFQLKEQTQENVVVMRVKPNQTSERKTAEIIFPPAFYEYFEVVGEKPSKVG